MSSPYNGIRLALCLLGSLWTAAATGKPPSLYTEKQAAAGATAYRHSCASCHGPRLEGQSAGYAGPALRGREFADPAYNFNIRDIFNSLSRLMPATKPGSLRPDVAVAIMAFLLQQNGYPAGPRELTYATAVNSAVPMLYYGE